MGAERFNKLYQLLRDANRSFLFSTIVPVYNTSDYLEEALESILQQTIGFEQNIQLILVNDGSTDNSGTICSTYASRYPNNIHYLEIENSGVSAARNIGLTYASGLYINFFDSDDIWSEDAYEHAANFFADNPNIKIASAKHRFFGARVGPHPLAFKYQHAQILNIIQNPDSPQLALNSAFVSYECFNDEPFDSNLKVSEDFKLMCSLLLKHKYHGVLKDPIYWYRKRETGTSALDSSGKSREWFFDPLIHCSQYLFDLSQTLYGQIIPYVQYAIMYDLQWRIKETAAPPPRFPNLT